MNTNWTKLTPEQKREIRVKQWLSPTDIKFKNKKADTAYRERALRMYNVLQVKEPDRVPVMLPAGNFPAYYTGGSLHKVMYDYGELGRAWTKFLYDFQDDMDSFNGPGLTYSGRVLEIMDYKLYKWPGHGLSINANTYQFVEGEYMMADEYDALIKDPSDFAFRVLTPRVVGALEPFKKLPILSSLMGMPMRIINPGGLADIRAAYKALINAGKELSKWQKVQSNFNRTMLAAGFPGMRSSMAVAPFDTVGDALRGTQGVIMDMYRQPDKLLAAIDCIADLTINESISSINNSGGFIVDFPLHKGDDTFMSNKQFEKFYWPSLRKVILALINEGIMVSLFAEGRYMLRLEAVKDLPKGWVMWRFDQTDMVAAKKVLGDRCCISGNIPTSLLCAGTPKQIKEYCRKLIEDCGPGGGYILTGGASATESNPRNLRVLMQAAKEYGMYK
jgi:hypothetical protein